MEYKYFTVDISDHVEVVTFDRPKANSINLGVMAELRDIVIDVRENHDVRVLVFRSANERFFCAGADINMFAGRDPDADRIEEPPDLQAIISDIENLDIPTIAMIAGHCTGGGLEWVLACDFRIGCHGEATMGLPEVNLGIIPAAGGTQRLARLIGCNRAKQMMFLGQRVSIREALDMEIIDSLYYPIEFESSVMDFARSLAGQAPLAVQSIKRCVRTGMRHGLEKGLALEKESIAELFGTEDVAEGVQAFFEKRKPDFKGR